MIIIHGIYRFGLKKAAIRKDFCNSCRNEGIAEQWQSFDCFHIFWIPLIPLGTKRRWICSHCGEDPRAETKMSPVLRYVLLLGLPFILGSLWVDRHAKAPPDQMTYIMTAVLGGIWLWILYGTFKRPTGRTNEELRAAVIPLCTDECLYCHAPLTLHPYMRCQPCGIRIEGEPRQRTTATPPPLPSSARYQEMPSSDTIEPRPSPTSTMTCENQMAQWLAHPNEFGVPPLSVRHKHTYHLDLLGHGDVEVHLVEYAMPDGRQGRGFVNGSYTWSFLGDGVNAIDNDHLLLAYCGWLWLTPAMHTGSVITRFDSAGEEMRYLNKKQQQGITEVSIANRYKIGTSELFEFTGRYQGKPAKGAGDTSHDIGFVSTDPCFNLPPIYFLVGQQVIKAMR
jgi:hypothetical protein